MRGNQPKHSYDLYNYNLLSKLEISDVEIFFLHVRIFVILEFFPNSSEKPSIKDQKKSVFNLT